MGKVEVLRLTQSELGNTVEEVNCDTFDDAKSGFKQGLNSSFDCWPSLNLEASIFGSFKQIFFEAELGWLGLLFFFSELWVTMVQNDLTEILQTWKKYQMLHCDKHYSEVLSINISINITNSWNDLTIK